MARRRAIAANGVLMLLACLSACQQQQPSTTAPATPPAPLNASTEPASPLSVSLSVDRYGKGDSTTTRKRERGQGAVRFTDVAREMGVSFRYDTGRSSRRLMVEATGGGAGWVDFDRDGWCDLFFCQGGDPAAADLSTQPTDRLFRSLGGTRFVDVTVPATLIEQQYGQGVAVADYDEDGFDDILVTNVGPESLFRNLGDGTFEERAAAAGVGSRRWSSSAAWGDLDGDGDLDLYLCNYLDYDPRNPLLCLSSTGEPGTCHPEEVPPSLSECYFNQGDGRFTEEAGERGLTGSATKALGVIITDFDGDGRPDVFVANDTTANHFFANRGEGRFEEVAGQVGCATNALGQYQANMGMAFGDYDHSGTPDVYITHFTDDSDTLFRNLGAAGFEDVTRREGLHEPTLPYLGFGAVMADYDCNGEQDIFVANGHIDDWREVNGDPWHMPSLLFSYDGVGRWHDRTADAGPYLKLPRLGRAVASADFDADGDLDLAVVNQDDDVAILRNDSSRGHWLKVRLLGRHSNRSAIGAKVTVKASDRSYVQHLAGGTSYCSAHQPLLAFGLAEHSGPVDLRIVWPDGGIEERSGVAVDGEVVLVESREG
ncbi:CRTAC1 family protein [Planctomyces sp. SH-PL14]|uniref:CRTAC1 family protein n=1 Tax=Planctomyces sp. SH-PL14 TaxID=1632864 RepID=UPI00078ECD8A|nr:CRTAC1 family protein [Planctomyces sp. SH-PL14]AMV18768.1 ASPIC and UnbV [Planctomyces sp. SH-PL14]